MKACGEFVGGRYQVRCLLAQGASADVYRAIDTQTSREVVLKIPRGNIAGDLVALRHFRRELEIRSTLDQPGVQRVLSDGRDPYLVLEYVDGQSLRAYMRSNGPLPVAQVVDIGTQLGDVLDYVHQRGLVHRDVKPDNILIEADGHIVLTDFGIASRMRRRFFHLAQVANAVGTPDYMAPEQVRGQACDARTDVYAVGCVLYELLTGVVPYPTEATHGAAETQLPLVRARRPDVPAELEAVLYRAIRRRASERYASMAALAHDLRHLEMVHVPASYHLDEPAPAPLGDLPPMRTTLPVLSAIVIVLGAIGVFAQWAHNASPH